MKMFKSIAKVKCFLQMVIHKRRYTKIRREIIRLQEEEKLKEIELAEIERQRIE